MNIYNGIFSGKNSPINGAVLSAPKRVQEYTAKAISPVLSYSSVSENSVTLSWTNPESKNGFEVFVNNQLYTFTNVTGVTINGLQKGTEYFFKVRVNDGIKSLMSNTEIVKTLGVLIVPPSIENLFFTINEGGACSFVPDLSENEGVLDVASIVITSQANNGVITVNQISGEITFTADAHFYGQDSFTFRLSNTNGDQSNEVVFTVNVNPVPDVSQTVTAGQTVYAGILI